MLNRLRNLVLSSANQITFVTALRGTVGAGVPFIVLRVLGFPIASLFATFGGLNVSIADPGGPYRRRLITMVLVTLIMPSFLFAGTQVRNIHWLAVTLVLAVSFVGGLLRVLGRPGFVLGFISTLVLLIGMEIPLPLTEAVKSVSLYYVAGGWIILLTLTVWKLRPYKRIELHIAALYSAVANLINLLQEILEEPENRPKDYDEDLTSRHQAIRNSVNQVRKILGEELINSGDTDASVNRLIVLIRSARQVSAGALNLGENLSRQSSPPGGRHFSDSLQEVLQATANVTKAIVSSLEAGTVSGSIRELTSELNELTNQVGGAVTAIQGQESQLGGPNAVLIALDQIVRHLRNAQEALEGLFGKEHRIPGLIPLSRHPLVSSSTFELLRSNLTMRSLMFRHALRLALADAFGCALFVSFDLKHGIWIPLTTLIVLRPKFGATIQRTMYRTAGTLAGAAIASVLAALLHRTLGIEIAVIIAIFGTFLFFKRHYAIAITFLTPLIILLLDLITHSPFRDIIDRVVFTLSGAVIALGAGYLLWPIWQHEQLPSQIGAAIDRNRTYLRRVLHAFSTEEGEFPSVRDARTGAEVETGNAEAAFQQMLSEPKHKHKHVDLFFSVITHLSRLHRHLTALAIHLDEKMSPPLDFESLLGGLEDILGEVREAIQRDEPPSGTPKNMLRAFEKTRQELRDRAQNSHAPTTGAEDQGPSRKAGIYTSLDFLLELIVAYVSNMHSALEGSYGPS